MIIIQSDEHIKKSITEGLKAREIEIYSIEDENLKGISDEKLLDFCIDKKRVLLTNDDDFLRLIETRQHSGIIFITTQFASVGELIRGVIRLVDTIPEDSFKSSVFFIP